jgi:hypothetical protein
LEPVIRIPDDWLPTVLDQIAGRLEEAKMMINIEPLAAVHNDEFSRYATKLRRIKMWWDSKIAPDSEDLPPLQNMGVTEVVGDLWVVNTVVLTRTFGSR